MELSTMVLLVSAFVIKTGYQVSARAELGLGGYGSIGRDGIGLHGLKYINLPIIGSVYDVGQIGLDKHGLSLDKEIGIIHGQKGVPGKPEIPGVSVPDLGVSTPNIGVSLPALGVSTPDTGVSIPGLGVSTPDTGVSIPGLGVSTPDTGVSIQGLGVSTPDTGVSIPGLGVSTPGMGVTIPGLGITIPGLGVSLPDLETSSPAQPTTLSFIQTTIGPELDTELPSPDPSTPTPETITLETTPAGKTCNQTECEIDCERKGHLAKFANCEPNEQTGSCACGGSSCLPDPCYQKCRDDDYQRGYCRNSTAIGSNCYCFGCKQPFCYNSCRLEGWPKGFCKYFGQNDERGNEMLECRCFGVKRKEPYPITTAATTMSTLDVLVNNLASPKPTS